VSRPEMAMPGTGMICKPECMSRPVGTAMQTKPGSDMTCNTIRPEGTSLPMGTAMQTEPGTEMAPLAAASVQGTLPSRQHVFGERGVATCDVGQLFKPPKGSSAQLPATTGAPRCSKRARHAAAPPTGVLRARFYFVRCGQLFKPPKSSSDQAPATTSRPSLQQACKTRCRTAHRYLASVESHFATLASFQAA
jgi:hypothetical protein